MKIWLTLFSLMAIVQLAIPANMIWQQERTLHLGREFKFQTAPVDPVDLFRGRYVALRFKANSVPVSKTAHFSNGQTVYVTLGTDAHGFAKLVSVSSTLKAAGKGNVIRAKVGYQQRGSGELRVQFPFDRFYLDESIAPKAEEIYRKASRQTKGEKSHESYVIVRVYHGKATLEDLIIDGKPIREIARKLR